jgi:ribosomal protein L19
VQIPTELLVGDIDPATRKQLKAGFNIIEKSSSLSGDSIRDAVNKIRKDYTKPIQKYGSVLLKTNKQQFNAAITVLKTSIAEFQEQVKSNLEAEIQKAQTNLAKMLSPAIKAKPPTELKNQITNHPPTDEQVEKYLELKLTAIFPNAESIIKAMSVNCVFKAVTYETISHEDFQKQIQEAYPLINWGELFEEYSAAPENNLQNDLFKNAN